MTNLIMPAYGISGAGGLVSRWLKRTGEKVEKGESVVEIETEKAVAELEAPCAGYLVTILAPEGAQVESGQTLAQIRDEGEIADSSGENRAHRVDTFNAASSDQKGRAQSGVLESSPKVSHRGSAPETIVKASPGARRLSAELAVDITRIAGTGPQGRIVESDVRAFLDNESKSRKAPPDSERRTETLTPIRLSIAERMLESVRSIPHFHLSLDVDAKGVRAVREGRFAAPKPSVTAVVLKVLGDTLKEWPRLNASWGNGGIDIHDAIHVNIAVATDRGLLAPLIRNVPSKTLRELDAELRDLAARAREGHLRLEDCSQGTITLTNLGMYGIRQFDPIVNPPQCSILAVGSIRESPFARNGLLGIREEMTLTLAVDHRIVDGAEAAQFLGSLGKRLEDLASAS
jgi:pyruvate dehydrogenase E2 component (dihydrolipoyllysine-residue acetyltransferase)